MCIIPSIAIGSNFQAIQSNNFMKLEQILKLSKTVILSLCLLHPSKCRAQPGTLELPVF